MRGYDVAVVGAGIVGLATAFQLSRSRPGLRLCIIDKESRVAAHQSGHNSGVLHSGIYYKPGSSRSKLCRRGLSLMLTFCQQEGIPFEICGKVIVATRESELPRLRALYERGQSAGIRCEVIGTDELCVVEPACVGVSAIHVKEAGIADFQAVSKRLADLVTGTGAEMMLGAKVVSVAASEAGWVIGTTSGEIGSRVLVNCAGLQSDLVAQMSGEVLTLRIVPFRGEYYDLKAEARGLCRNLIYPVPDPSLPFLGVHFTRRISGEVECGPNAVFALAREGYTRWRFHARELAGSLSYPGVWRLGAKHLRTGCFEAWRSLSKRAFVRSLQELVPSVRSEDLIPGRAGVRAQAVARDGSLVDDFAFAESERALHVLNAPSPAATASLAIGEELAAKVLARL